jgi:hypothetical protein
MNATDTKHMIKQLRKDIVNEYNKIMPELYKRYRNIPHNQVRIIVTQTILNHALDKTREDLYKKSYKKVRKIFVYPTEEPKAEELDFDVCEDT